MRRAVYVVVALLAVLVLSGLSGLVYLHQTHPRDEAGFLDYVERYGGPTGDPLTAAQLPGQDVLVAEGDRACDWLAVQPYALWRHAPAFRHQALLDGYTSQTDLTPLTWSNYPERQEVARAAWRSLCPATWELHRPHFYEPGGD